MAPQYEIHVVNALDLKGGFQLGIFKSNRNPTRRVWVRAIELNDNYRLKLDLRTEENDMNAEQIKDEIRKLSRVDKLEIYRWIDEEAAADLLSRIGVFRSLEIRQEIEQKCKVTRKSLPLADPFNDTDHRILAIGRTDQ